MPAPRQQQQDPAEQQPDRQASDIAEKQPRHRAVERRKSDRRAEQRQRDQHRERRCRADRAEQHDTRSDRHDLRDSHPVETVHEVDEVHEPDAAEHHHRAFRPLGKLRHDAEVRRKHRDDEAHRNELHQQPWRRPEAAQVVDRADNGKKHGRNRQREQCVVETQGQRAEPDAGERRGDHRDAAALWCRLGVRRARIRARQRVALEQRLQRDDQPRAQARRDKQHETDQRPG